MPQPLPSRERGLFAQVVKNFENKQYKKGIKAADQILKKHPNHGDTQAMKALILNSQGQTDDGFALGKEALKNDMKSPICWHVYGLLYRAAKNYEEAIKAYKFALRLDPDSQQIQRDLALLQIHMRDYAGSVQSRKAMLQARPQIRMNWTALAVAYHMSEDYAAAERVLTTYDESLRQPPPKSDIEHQEATLYKNTIIAEMGEVQRALEHLDAATKNNFDRQSVMEMRAEYLLRLERHDEAAKAWRKLLDRNAENREHYDGLRRALKLADSDIDGLKDVYAEYAEKAPGNDTPRRVPLEFLQGDDFRSAVDKYLQEMLRKGVPSTFTNLKALYSNPKKRDIIQSLVEGYAANFPGDPPKNDTAAMNGAKAGDDAEARHQLAILYFLAQHYNHHRSRDLKRATELVEKLLARQPDSTDFHMTHARILKHSGALDRASTTMDHARSLDTRDRYINTKAAKYQLRHDQNDTALATLSKFTRAEAAGGALGDLVDMQAVWYLLADGSSQLRQQRLGPALKRFAQVGAAFDTWQEDQFDFHSFALRKGQARAYVAMLRWQDALRAHPYFARAALGAIEAYVRLHDVPGLAQGPEGGRGKGDGALANGVNGEGVSAAARKKAAQRVRKEARERERAEQAEAEKRDARRTAGGAAATVAADGEAKKVDEDPEGKALAHTKEPLKDAMAYVGPLQEFHPKSLEAQQAGFEVFIRRRKHLLALRCLRATHAIAPNSPNFHNQLYRLHHALRDASSAPPPTVSQVLAEDLDPLFPSGSHPVDIVQANTDFLAGRGKGDLAAALAVLSVRRDVEGTEGKWRGEAPVLLAAALEHAGGELGWEEAEDAQMRLRVWGCEVEPFAQAARKRWPEATAFGKGRKA